MIRLTKGHGPTKPGFPSSPSPSTVLRLRRCLAAGFCQMGGFTIQPPHQVAAQCIVTAFHLYFESYVCHLSTEFSIRMKDE